MLLVELPQGAEVPAGQGLQENPVVGAVGRCHTSTVDLAARIGSLLFEDL
ncbi:MAG: hypothetical protein L0H79_18145 [Intrasporangium sp.]|nr:hypothetical protein [Intrasporangium sp.]MDN5797648.1 hypothetical protein [Intrasporangium sp.]